MSSAPRPTSRPCPHCGATRITGHHYRDAGAATATEAEAFGYCPELARRRTATPAPHRTLEAFVFDRRDRLAPSDLRIAARQDEADQHFTADDYAEALARALANPHALA